MNDVAIVGGGPAGAALAIALGRRGVRVALYEQAKGPRLKPCGEGLLPHGVAVLSDLTGLPDALPVRGLRFVVGPDEVVADFPDTNGLVVRRDRLDAWLLERAGATPNVDVRLGARWPDSSPGGERFIVGADGRRSQFHRRLPSHRPGPGRIGLSAHAEGIEGLSDRVEVFFHPDGEVYLAPTGGGEAVVAGLFRRARFRRDGLQHLLHVIPELRARTQRVTWTSPRLACAPLTVTVPRVVERNLLLIGDAAGTADSITGDGMATALVSAVAAADAIVTGNLQAYQSKRLDLARSGRRLANLLLRLSALEGRAARLLVRRPRLASTLLDVAVGRRPLTAATAVRALVGRP